MIIQADKSFIGERVDAFLSKKISELSRSSINRLIKSKEITSKLGAIKSSHIIKGDEVFEINLPKPEESFLTPLKIDLEIIYSDEHLAVINKPRGLTVHPGAGEKNKTLCHALLYHFPEIVSTNAERPGIVHRLDKDTSGLMIIAKTTKAHQKLSEAFKNRQIKKIYRAICWGEIEKKNFELITGHIRHPYNRLKFFTGLNPPQAEQKNNRIAHTEFKVVKTFFGLTELIAILHTGRTHQIRAHLSDIGHPIVGDSIYGGSRTPSNDMPNDLKQAVLDQRGQALHSEQLEFLHPINKKLLAFNLPYEFLT